jgi:predicted Rossmann fold nucleotide-binding protein DprA/Smf involved in DNA uptake
VLAVYGKAQRKRAASAGVPDGADDDTLGALERQILTHLRREPMPIDELVRTLQASSADLGTALSLLALSGRVIEAEGRYTLISRRRRC